MLDKFGLKLLNILNEEGSFGDYIVISLDELYNKFKNKASKELIQNTLDYLASNDYIKIKYKDEEEICYTCLTKARIVDETKLVNKNNKKEINKLIVLNIILSCLSAFFGAFIAILIVHFFL